MEEDTFLYSVSLRDRDGRLLMCFIATALGPTMRDAMDAALVFIKAHSDKVPPSVDLVDIYTALGGYIGTWVLDVKYKLV